MGTDGATRGASVDLEIESLDLDNLDAEIKDPTGNSPGSVACAAEDSAAVSNTRSGVLEHFADTPLPNTSSAETPVSEEHKAGSDVPGSGSEDVREETVTGAVSERVNKRGSFQLHEVKQGKELFKAAVKGHIEGFTSPGESPAQGGMFGEMSKGDEDVVVPFGKYSKMMQIHVEVYQTLMIKCLRYSSVTDNILMVGTMIQRCVNDPRITIDHFGFYRFCYDLSNSEKEERLGDGGANESGSGHVFMEENPYERPFFTYRMNDLPYDISDSIRKVTIVRCAFMDKHGNEIITPCSITNTTVEIPCILRSAFNGKPYQISTCEALIELTSRYAGDYEYRPTMVANRGGMDNIVCVRDPEELDELQSFDLMWDYPTIEVPNEGKMKKGKMVQYTPKILVYFFLSTSAMEAFIKSFMPILFATVAQTMNCVTSEMERIPESNFNWDADSWSGVFLTNTITVGIAVIFVLPDITNDSNSFSHEISYNEIYILIFFSGLTVGCIYHKYAMIVCVFMMWSSLIIPILSLLRYRHVKHMIHSKTSKALVRAGGANFLKKKKQQQEETKLETVTVKSDLSVRSEVMEAAKHVEEKVKHAVEDKVDEFKRALSLNSEQEKARAEQEAKEKIKNTNKSGAELNGKDLMPFFEDKTGEVNDEILRQSGKDDLFPFAHSVIHERKRYFVMGKRKIELAREGTMTDLFCHDREKRRANRRAAAEDKAMKKEQERKAAIEQSKRQDGTIRKLMGKSMSKSIFPNTGSSPVKTGEDDAESSASLRTLQKPDPRKAPKAESRVDPQQPKVALSDSSINNPGGI